MVWRPAWPSLLPAKLGPCRRPHVRQPLGAELQEDAERSFRHRSRELFFIWRPVTC